MNACTKVQNSPLPCLNAPESSRGLSVGCVTSESSVAEKDKVSNGQYQLVLFSPEALLSVRRWREMLRDETYTSRIVAFVVDEAHCVKKW